MDFTLDITAIARFHINLRIKIGHAQQRARSDRSIWRFSRGSDDLVEHVACLRLICVMFDRLFGDVRVEPGALVQLFDLCRQFSRFVKFLILDSAERAIEVKPVQQWLAQS